MQEVVIADMKFWKKDSQIIDQSKIEKLTNEGMSHFKSGNYDEALNCYLKVIKIVPDSPNVLHSIGSAYACKNELNTAISYFDKILEIDSNHYKALWDKAFTLNQLTRYEEAITCYERILGSKPYDTRVMEDKASTLFNMGAYEDSLLVCDRILKLDPNNPSVMMIKIGCLQNLNRQDEAQKCFESMREKK